MEYNLKLTLKDIPKIVEQIIEKLESIGLYNEIPMDVRLALEEALTNAVKHGNKSDPNKSIFIKVQPLSDRLEIEVADEGEGFDHVKVPMPTDDENIWKTSGRGVFLIRHFMDKAEYCEGGRRLCMVKYLKAKKGK